MLSPDRPIPAQALDAHVVHADVSADRTLGVGLGDDEKRPAEHPRPEIGRECIERPGFAIPGLVVVPQDPEPGPLLDLNPVTSRVVGFDAIGPVAEEDEAGVDEPAKQLLDLLQLGRSPRDCEALGFEFADQRPGLFDHGREVLGHGPHDFESLSDLRLEHLLRRRVMRSVEHDVHDRHPPAFGGVVADVDDTPRCVAVDDDDGVEEVGDFEFHRVQVLAERVDDEGPVLHHRLEDPARRILGVPLDPDRDGPVGRALDEVVEGGDVVGDAGDRASVRDGGVTAAEQPPGKPAHGLDGRFRETRLDLADQRVEVRLLHRLLFHARRYPLVPAGVNGERAGPRIVPLERARSATPKPRRGRG